jgi:hypothetical protein
MRTARARRHWPVHARCRRSPALHGGRPIHLLSPALHCLRQGKNRSQCQNPEAASCLVNGVRPKKSASNWCKSFADVTSPTKTSHLTRKSYSGMQIKGWGFSLLVCSLGFVSSLISCSVKYCTIWFASWFVLVMSCNWNLITSSFQLTEK